MDHNNPSKKPGASATTQGRRAFRAPQIIDKEDLTDEQRARIDENRRRALEKKQTRQLQGPTPSQPTTYSHEQRARMEKNRIAALEKRKNLSKVATSSDQASLSKNTGCPPPLISVEQRAMIEKNQQQMSKLALPSQQDDVQSLPSPIPEKTTRPLTNDNSKSGSPEYSEEQRAPNDETIFQEDHNYDNILDLQDTVVSSTPSKKKTLPPIPPELQYEEARALPIDDDKTDRLIENAELDSRLLNGISLQHHQKEAITTALRMRRLVFIGEQLYQNEWGRIISSVWAKSFLETFEELDIFVVAPIALHDAWKMTAMETAGLTLDNIFSWTSMHTYEDDADSDYVVICDEAHHMQSLSSERTKAALKMVLNEKCQGVLLMSRAPMAKSRPSSLFPLLKAVKHPFGDDQNLYEEHFCSMSNLEELHAHTASHVFPVNDGA